MRFKARELPPYAEPIEAEDLEEGKIYFSIVFLDNGEMLAPEVRPWVFVGLDLQPGDIDQAYFQDLASHREGTRFSSEDRFGAEFTAGPKNELNHFFQFEKALEVLLRCSLRREELGVDD